MPSNYEYDSQPMVRSIISIVACVLIGAILLIAGVGKIAEFGTIPGQTDFLDKFIPDFILHRIWPGLSAWFLFPGYCQ